MRVSRGNSLFGHDGITLIELLVVISIIGILVIALGFSYQGWMGRYRVESQIKQIYSDMMNARMTAMSRNLRYFADFPTATTYRIFQDTNGNTTAEPGGGDTILPTFPKTIEGNYVLFKNWAGAGTTATSVIFEIRGTMQTPSGLGDTLCLRTVENPQLAGLDPDYDCIIIGQTRINMGKMTNPAGACNSGLGGNCVAK